MATASTVTYPSLSDDGFVHEPMKLADYLMASFMLSDNSQSYLYAGQITSLPYLMAQYNGDVQTLCSSIQSSLYVYLSRYFDNVLVEAVEEDNPSGSARSSIRLFVSFSPRGSAEVLNIARLLPMLDSKSQQIIDLQSL